MKLSLTRLLLAASLALPCVAPVVASAQSMVAKTITFTGAPQSQADLLTLSGLTPGKTLTKDDIDAAANRLDASGLFSSVQWSANAGVLTFTLESSARAQMQQVRYANFVWYTQSELNAAVQAKLPLFTGSVPANGELKDQVAQTLVAILKQRGIDATVDSVGISGGKFEYKITSPKVVVTDLQIENIRWDSDPTLTSVRQAMVDVDYLEGITQQGVHENTAYALKELGFLDATVGPIAHSEPKVEANRIAVVMTGAATPGARYKIARVTLPTPIGTVTASELESGDQQIKLGGLPSPSLVQNTTARMAAVFQRHGFLDAKSSVDTLQDNTAHTVSYTFAVAPGEVYRMRDLLFAADLNPDQKAQLSQAWKLPKGAVYESDPVNRTLLVTLKTLCAGHAPTRKLVSDPATHQVDITLSCQPQR
jgi:outer membrane protein assembly factor BamA